MSAFSLYLIGLKGGPVKIGVSSNAKKRLGQLQNGFHLKLAILKKWHMCPDNAYRYERVVLHHLSEYRLQGEWLSCPPDKVVKEIENIRNKTKQGRDWSSFKESLAAKVRSSSMGATASTKKRLREAKLKAAGIADRWKGSPFVFSTKELLEEAGLCRNTAKKHLGHRMSYREAAENLAKIERRQAKGM